MYCRQLNATPFGNVQLHEASCSRYSMPSRLATNTRPPPIDTRCVFIIARRLFTICAAAALIRPLRYIASPSNFATRKRTKPDLIAAPALNRALAT